MPLTKFRCPNNQEVFIAACLNHCHLAHRCVTKPTLYTILAGQREWTGRPSTTQLLNGTMLEWLKATMPYTISPRDMAFSLLGTTHHANLAKVQDGQSIIEQQVATEKDDITGIADLLMPDERSPDSYELVDYKTFGSYKVAQILGITSMKSQHPTEVYQRSGSWGKVGTPKTITTFYTDPAKVDCRNEELQLNHYRLKLESHGYQISQMNLQITVRDGNTQVAESRGITQAIYYPVEIRQLPDQEVRNFFIPKALALVDHITREVMPEPCNKEEAWEGRRCRSYCDVAEFCPKGQRELALDAGSKRS